MSKVHPLEISRIYEADSGEMMGWWSKGHYPKQEFVQAVLEMEQKESELVSGESQNLFYCDEKELLEQTFFDQTHYRIVLSGNFDESGKRVYLPMECGPGRGACPTTQLLFLLF